MQNHLIPTTKEWKVIEESLKSFIREQDKIKYLDEQDLEQRNIVENILLIINNHDILNDKY